MALNRLGVPANMINMIHSMEVEGITIVRTPLTQYIYDTEGMEGLRRLDAQFPWDPHTAGEGSTSRGHREPIDLTGSLRHLITGTNHTTPATQG